MSTKSILSQEQNDLEAERALYWPRWWQLTVDGDLDVQVVDSLSHLHPRIAAIGDALTNIDDPDSTVFSLGELLLDLANQVEAFKVEIDTRHESKRAAVAEVQS